MTCVNFFGEMHFGDSELSNKLFWGRIYKPFYRFEYVVLLVLYGI